MLQSCGMVGRLGVCPDAGVSKEVAFQNDVPSEC